MTKEQFEAKEKEVVRLRKQYKFNVIHEDSATKINHIKELITNLEKEITNYNIR